MEKSWPGYEFVHWVFCKMELHKTDSKVVYHREALSHHGNDLSLTINDNQWCELPPIYSGSTAAVCSAAWLKSFVHFHPFIDVWSCKWEVVKHPLASEFRSGCMNMCCYSVQACHSEDSPTLRRVEHLVILTLSRFTLTTKRSLIRAVHMLPLSHFLSSRLCTVTQFSSLFFFPLLDLIWCQGWRSLAPMSHCSAPVALWKHWT